MEHSVDQMQQLNVRLRWTSVAAVKRMAAEAGVAVNTYLDAVIEDLMAKKAETLRQQITAERAEIVREQDALMEALNKAEANASESKREVKR